MLNVAKNVLCPYKGLCIIIDHMYNILFLNKAKAFIMELNSFQVRSYFLILK